MRLRNARTYLDEVCPGPIYAPAGMDLRVSPCRETWACISRDVSRTNPSRRPLGGIASYLHKRNYNKHIASHVQSGELGPGSIVRWSPSLAHLAPGGRRPVRPPTPPPARANAASTAESKSRRRPVVRPPCGTPRSGPTPREVGSRASPTPAPACARLRSRCCCDSRGAAASPAPLSPPPAPPPRGPCGMDLRKRGEGRVHSEGRT